MCGIVGAFLINDDLDKLRPQILKMSKRIRHRGPDWSGIYTNDHAILSHERLAIVDPTSGKQPLFGNDNKIILAVNGEIYNHKELRNSFPDYPFKTQSDCEVILALYQEKGKDFLDDLNGIFGFALYDEEKDAFLIARDHMGIIPLYYGTDNDGQFYVASELKALEGICSTIKTFPPGHYIYSPEGLEPQKWYSRDWENFENVKNNTTDISQLREALEKAVHRQLMSDVPYGVLLSGGLDSSVVAAITKKFA